MTIVTVAAAVMALSAILMFEYLSSFHEQGKNGYYYRSSYVLLAFGVFFIVMAFGYAVLEPKIKINFAGIDYSPHYYLITAIFGFIYSLGGAMRYRHGPNRLDERPY